MKVFDAVAYTPNGVYAEYLLPRILPIPLVFVVGQRQINQLSYWRMIMRELAKCEVNTISGGLNCSELDDWATEPVERSVVPGVQDPEPWEDSDPRRHPPALGMTPVK
jgi:hypothetical protein